MVGGMGAFFRDVWKHRTRSPVSQAVEEPFRGGGAVFAEACSSARLRASWEEVPRARRTFVWPRRASRSGDHRESGFIRDVRR